MKRVYFIKPIGMDGPIKIGCSFSPTNRREQLATWSPFPLEIIAELDGDVKLERRFHARFAASHNGHEWFAVTDDLLKVIAEVRDGTFDVDTLPEPKYLRMKQCEPATRTYSKWSDEQRQTVLMQNALRRAEKASGFVLDWPERAANWAAFAANPCAETGGITRQELARRDDERHAAYHLREAERINHRSTAQASA